MLKESRINDQVRGEGYRVTSLDDVTSTNDLVKAAIRAGEPEGYVACALSQGAGYGRQGHAWKSPLGGLYFSILLRPRVALDQFPTLSQTSSLAICEALGNLGGHAYDALRIKWPNDVMSPDGKLAGISLEQLEGAVCVGIGINVFAPLDTRDRAVGGKYTPAYLAEIHGGGTLPRVDARGLSPAQLDLLERILVDTLMCFGARYRQWEEGGFAALREDYLSRLDLLGEEVTVERLDGSFFASGKVVNVNEAGQLVLHDGKGDYLRISAGEVHLR